MEHDGTPITSAPADLFSAPRTEHLVSNGWTDVQAAALLDHLGRAKDPAMKTSPAYHDARGKGWNVNHKKILRLWRDEGLRVPQRLRRKRVGTSTIDAPAADAPMSCGPWISSSMSVSKAKHPRSVQSWTSTPANASAGWSNDRSRQTDSSNTWKTLITQRGAPAVLRTDNGPRVPLRSRH